MPAQLIGRREALKRGLFTLASLSWINNSNFPVSSERNFLSTGREEDFPLWLNQNESPYGPPPQAGQAATQALARAHLYPHEHYSELKDLLAREHQISPDYIILGAGSTEIMTMAINSFGRRGQVVMADPTYFDFVDYAAQAGCSTRKVPLNSSFSHDLAGMKKAVNSKTSLVYICNPHNPTGMILAQEDLIDFCQQVARVSKAVILVDEAYYDYVEDGSYQSMISLVRQDYPLLVTRTFSKIYGLAGLRVGYGLAPPPVIHELERVRTNFASIAFPSLQAALAALSEKSFLARIKAANARVRKFTVQSLLQKGYFVLSGQTNFILLAVPEEARQVAERLARLKVYVRPFSFQCQHWLRVTLGKKEEMGLFLKKLSQLNLGTQGG